MSERASRTNKGKIDLQQVPPEVVWAICVTLMKNCKTFGGKYDEADFKKGFSTKSLISCAERHIDKFKTGLDIDEEDGVPHTWHALTNLAFLVFNQIHHPELDDRDKRFPLDTTQFEKYFKQGFEKVTKEYEGSNYNVTSGTTPCDGNPELKVNKSFKGGME